MIPEVYSVVKVITETKDVFTLECTPANSKLPKYVPGQFSMLTHYQGGEIPISLSGQDFANKKLFYTIRNVGYVTNLLSKLRPGDQIGVRGPYGTSWPLLDRYGKKNDILLIAGGIGIAPIRSIVHYLLNSPNSVNKIELLYGTKTSDNIIFFEQVATWEKQTNFSATTTVDYVAHKWHGPVGPVTTLIDNIDFNPEKTIAITCGPDIMMHFTILSLLNRGVLPENIYLSAERNMQCAIGVCGHCLWQEHFVCKDGPVFQFAEVAPIFRTKEL